MLAQCMYSIERFERLSDGKDVTVGRRRGLESGENRLISGQRDKELVDLYSVSVIV